ncbi:Uncharacterized protein PECH_002199 [Penicillium ucsense]|uniref:mRNA-capping enzyme subunit beta n=1 Tax=Penicillium ucsense TaxID=2839758 RepID=A0A8J8VZG2_9EURO|nr:Uncharacterized protein PECM_008345 [Penicillium ucsense]KAF7731160.1 Uncharacterized protein PECH_002199 [Penicillium ucsense]
MDLRTIMNNEGGGASKASQASVSSTVSSDLAHQQQQQQQTDYPRRRSSQSLQPIQQVTPTRHSSFEPTQSQYQQYPPAPPPLNTAVQSHPSLSPPPTSTPYSSGPRDSYSSSAYNNAHSHGSVGPGASPYTSQQPMSAGLQQVDQSSYFAQQRSNSLQSVMTNPLGAGDSMPPRESPLSASQPPFPQQQFSPSTHRSISGTPLGPPPIITSRQSTHSARPLSSGRVSPRNNPPSPRTVPEAQGRSSLHTQSPPTSHRASPSSRHSESASHPLTGGYKHESPESSSSRATSRQNSTATALDAAGGTASRPLADPTHTESPTALASSGLRSNAQRSPMSSTQPQFARSPSNSRSNSQALRMEIDNDSMDRGADHQPPKAKRRRYNEPPIFAQRSVRTKGRCPVIPHPQPPIPKHVRGSDRDPWQSRKQLVAASVTPAVQAAASVARSARAPAPVAPLPVGNGPTAASPSMPTAGATSGSLGPWEPSITGFIPYEELTKQLCDFLFQHVVMRTDVAVDATGSAAAGAGTIVEIEAKLGHVVDQDRRERLVLPVLTESVINRDSRVRTAFESNMTVEQHRAMNNFLNEQVKASMANTQSRIPISYTHKKERDTFYEISPQELPPVIRQNLNPRHKPKVRVTTDVKTGEIIAKIVKCRVADIDVYSPRTSVDWRVSVNLEMEYDGDISHLTMVDTSKGGRGERNKDRMSYKHLAYQIDLTQVATAEAPTKNDFEHELEVEVSAAEIRRQGNLAMAGDPSNQYEDLVKGFVDNIRVLARAVPP